MSERVKIRVKRPWIAYPGSTVQQSYAEGLEHGYLLWDVKGKNDHDVSFRLLPNPKPFATIEWQGNAKDTLSLATTFPKGSRFRIASGEQLSQKDSVVITSKLKQDFNATEVTFKNDQVVMSDVINTGDATFVKTDLRNPDVLLTLLKDYNKGSSVTNEEWFVVYDLLKQYLFQVNADVENSIVRNTKWALKSLSFDNTFAFGEGNLINLDSLSGICGIFGPNRLGKSSIVGTIMYALFNTTDRGSMKNLHIPNVRKQYCSTSATISVNGSEYLAERCTSKHESKTGALNANTTLVLSKKECDGELLNLSGEQRNASEKLLRSIIGSPEDFLMTSLSAQDEGKMFIAQGSTKRRLVLSKFLDLDIFDRLNELAKNDLNSCKTLLKNLPDRNWELLEQTSHARLEECESLLTDKNSMLVGLRDKLNQLHGKLASFKDFVPVTKSQVDSQKSRVDSLTKQESELSQKIAILKEGIESCDQKIKKAQSVIDEVDIKELKNSVNSVRVLESAVITLMHTHEKEDTKLKQQERSLKILSEVPCGDLYPSCKFIKDAHCAKSGLDKQKEASVKASTKFLEAKEKLDTIKTENAIEKLAKVERLNELCSKFRLEVSSKNLELVKLESAIESLCDNVEQATNRLAELQLALKNEENVEVVSLRNEIDKIQAAVDKLDTERLKLASEQGQINTNLVKYEVEQKQRFELLHKMRAYEIIVSAFSKKGIPNVIVMSQLPLINAEISKILTGIVNFTIELEADDDNESMEIYINYGDSKRVIELCSGMEKVIASIAIRVALINISSLPKTDMLIIDEGFGALDEHSVEECSKLLISLKRYFRLLLVITHVDALKDCVDQVIEISRKEKDSFVCVS